MRSYIKTYPLRRSYQNGCAVLSFRPAVAGNANRQTTRAKRARILRRGRVTKLFLRIRENSIIPRTQCFYTLFETFVLPVAAHRDNLCHSERSKNRRRSAPSRNSFLFTSSSSSTTSAEKFPGWHSADSAPLSGSEKH